MTMTYILTPKPFLSFPLPVYGTFESRVQKCWCWKKAQGKSEKTVDRTSDLQSSNPRFYA